MTEQTDKPKTPYRIFRTDDIVRVEFAEPHIVGQKSVTQLQERLHQVLKRVPDARIVLDLTNVQYLSSAALGELLAAHKQLVGNGGRMCMACVGPELMDILATTRLDAVFGIYDTPRDAINNFTRQ